MKAIYEMEFSTSDNRDTLFMVERKVFDASQQGFVAACRWAMNYCSTVAGKDLKLFTRAVRAIAWESA